MEELRKKYNIPLNAKFCFDEESQIEIKDENEIQAEFCLINNSIYLKKNKIENKKENNINERKIEGIKYTLILNGKQISELISENEMLNNVREKIKNNFQKNFLFLNNENPVQIKYENIIPIKNISNDNIIHLVETKQKNNLFQKEKEDEEEEEKELKYKLEIYLKKNHKKFKILY